MIIEYLFNNGILKAGRLAKLDWLGHILSLINFVRVVQLDIFASKESYNMEYLNSNVLFTMSECSDVENLSSVMQVRMKEISIICIYSVARNKRNDS